MIINIKPDLERREYSKSFIPNADVYMSGILGVNGWNFMSSEITPGEKTTFKTPAITLNNFIGYYMIAITDENDNILEIIPTESYRYNNAYSMYCDYPGMDPTFNEFVFLPLKEGQRYQLVSQDAELVNEYELLPNAPSLDPKDYKIVLGGMLYPSYFYATGNRSDVVDVKFHVDENLPAIFPIMCKLSKEFSVKRLKADDCADNISGPSKGISMEVKCSDKDGHEEEALYVEYQQDYAYEFNVSVLSDNIDVYIHYEYDGDTRHDSGLSSDSIIEQDGLIYKIIDNGVCLIGYDKIEDVVTIPEYVNSGDIQLPVVNINKDALLHAPAKELVIKAAQLIDVGNCAFAGMKQLKSVSFEGLKKHNIGFYNFSFLDTYPENIYTDSAPNDTWMTSLLSMGRNYFYSYFCSANEKVNFYISELFSDSSFDILNALYLLNDVKLYFDVDQLIGSYNIPGLGDSPYLDSINNFDVPICQMWEYSIDKVNGLIAFQNAIENIEIDNASINGTPLDMQDKGLFKISPDDLNSSDILVSFTINGNKKMTTTYPKEYNALVNSVDLSEVEEILGPTSIESIDVFNLQGVKVVSRASKTDIDTLPAGIYIIAGKKVYIK